MNEKTPLKEKEVKKVKTFWQRFTGHLSSKERENQNLELKTTGEAFVSMDSLAIAMQVKQKKKNVGKLKI